MARIFVGTILTIAVVAEAFAPIGDARFGVREAMPPMGIVLQRDERGIMCPMLEQSGRFRLQPFEMARPVGGVARIEDVMMRALDDADGIELHIAELADQRRERGEGSVLPHAGKPVPRQDQRTGLVVRDVEWRTHPQRE